MYNEISSREPPKAPPFQGIICSWSLCTLKIRVLSPPSYQPNIGRWKNQCALRAPKPRWLPERAEQVVASVTLPTGRHINKQQKELFAPPREAACIKKTWTSSYLASKHQRQSVVGASNFAVANHWCKTVRVLNNRGHSFRAAAVAARWGTRTRRLPGTWSDSLDRAAAAIAAPCAPRGHPSARVEAKPWASTERLGVSLPWGTRRRGRDRIKKGFYSPYGEFGGGKILKNWKIKIKGSQALRGGFKGGGAVLACKRMCPPTRPSHTRLSCELKGAEIILSEEKKNTAAPDLVKSQWLAAIQSHRGERWPGKWGGREGPREGGSAAVASIAQPAGVLRATEESLRPGRGVSRRWRDPKTILGPHRCCCSSVGTTSKAELPRKGGPRGTLLGTSSLPSDSGVPRLMGGKGTWGRNRLQTGFSGALYPWLLAQQAYSCPGVVELASEPRLYLI